MATHSSILVWRVPWTEEPGGLQFMGSQRVGHDYPTEPSTAGSLTFFLVVEKNAQPTLNHFKGYSSVVLSIFTLLGNQAPELSHLAKYSRIFCLRAPDPIYLPIKWAHF